MTVITSKVNSLYHLYGNPTPWLEKNGFLPTQKTLGSGPQLAQFNQTIPFYNKMITVSNGSHTPKLAEYPQIAGNVREAIEDFYYGNNEPKQGLDDTAAKICKGLRMVVEVTP